MGAIVSKGGLVFQPPPACGEKEKSRLGNDVNAHRFWLSTRLGSKIEAVYIEQRAAMTILFSHANAEDITMVYPWLQELSRHCRVNALAYSYSGYARSRDRPPSEQDVYADIDAAWDYLVLMKQLSPDSIILYGRSIGSGPTVYLAARLAQRQTPPAGIILQSPLLSIFRIAFNFRYTLPGDLFPNIDRIRYVASPVLLVHGGRDEVVPLFHSQELWLATPITWRYKPFWISTAGHNNIEVLLRHSGLLFQKFSEFLSHCADPAIQAKRGPCFARRKALLDKEQSSWGIESRSQSACKPSACCLPQREKRRPELQASFALLNQDEKREQDQAHNFPTETVAPLLSSASFNTGSIGNPVEDADGSSDATDDDDSDLSDDEGDVRW